MKAEVEKRITPIPDATALSSGIFIKEVRGRNLGHEVLVANAGRVSLIHQSDRKNDRLDARNLAKLARVDPSLLSPITQGAAPPDLKPP
jgi:hypothetical protein